jgi:hypothetical protein
MTHHYIFVLALARSGSTLLAYVLDSHSRIHVEHEDSGLPHATIDNKEIHNLREKIRNGFTGYLDGLLEKSHKEYLVTTRYYSSQHVQLITEALGPHVKFILLTRRHMWRTFKDADGNRRVVPLWQMLEFETCRRRIARYPHYTEVSYESMVREPMPTFSRMCEFIGVEFEPAMLDYASFAHPQLAHRGNTKARRLGKIVDHLDEEPHTWQALLREALARFGPRRPGS